MRNRQRHIRAALITAVSFEVLTLGAVSAQQAEPQDPTPSEPILEEVVVTGFRASLADALARKRDSNQIVEAVTAEDLGKFPDQNIAESLQRLSGVQIDRIAGQGTQVRIRGLDQNITLLDDDLFLTGLELYKLGEGNDRFRDSLESVPSELIGGVDVYKSATANLVEGALGGTINLRTRRAIDLKEGLTVGGNIRFNQSDYLDDWEPSGAVVFAFNKDRRFGATISVSYDSLAIHEDALGGANRGNWRFIDGLNGADGTPNTDERNFFDTVGTDYISPELLYTTHRDQYRERVGASIGLDFAPNEVHTFGFDWFHSDLDFSTEEVGNKVWFTSNNLGRGIDPAQPWSIADNGVIEEGTFRALGAEVISLVQAAEAQSDNFQLNYRMDNGGPVRAQFKASWSQADMTSDTANSDVQKTQYGVPTADASSPTGWSHQPSLNRAAPGASTGGYSFNYVNGNGYLPSVSYNAPFADLLTNPAYSMFKSHWVFGDRSDSEAYALRSDLQFSPQFLSSRKITLSGGARLSDRDVDFVSGRYLMDWSSQGATDGDPLGLEFGSWFYFQDAAIGDRGCDVGVTECGGARFGNAPLVVQPVQSFLSNPGRVETINDFFPTGNVGSSITAQSRAQMRNPAAWLQSLYPDQPLEFFRDEPESFVVGEKVTALYLMADIGNPDDRYHVNVGARVVDTDTDVEQHSPVPLGRYWGSDVWNGVARDFTTDNTGRSYRDTLPSLNAVYDLTDRQKLRFAAAKVMTRPNLFDLGRGFQTFFTRVTRTVNGVPVEGFEFTTGSSGNPELDPFRAKQMDLSWEYYFGQQNAIIVTGFWKEVDSFIAERSAPELVPDDFGGTFGNVTRLFNGTGGRIRGFELGGQYAFDYGLGFNANYTFSDSTSPISTSFETGLPIPGVSKHSYTVQSYFEKKKFAARLSYSWRDKALSAQNTTFNFDGVTYGVFNRSYGQLDGQISYQLTDKVGVLLEAVNINEADRKRYLQYENQPFTYNSGERRIFIGARAAF